MIDNAYRGEANIPGYSARLDLETRQIFIGAKIISWLGKNKINFGFIGCLDDVRLNKEPLSHKREIASGAGSLLNSENVSFLCPDSLKTLSLCETHPCQNGGVCKTRSDTYMCKCPARFKGKHCEIDTDPCLSSPCLNYGKCKQEGYSYKCECPTHVSGDRCQFLYCSPNPCLNEGTCEEGISGPICRLVYLRQYTICDSYNSYSLIIHNFFLLKIWKVL